MGWVATRKRATMPPRESGMVDTSLGQVSRRVEPIAPQTSVALRQGPAVAGRATLDGGVRLEPWQGGANEASGPGDRRCAARPRRRRVDHAGTRLPARQRNVRGD